MQQQEYNSIAKRLHSLERRARWHWAERLLTLILAAQLLFTEPAGSFLRNQAARLRPREASARLAFAEGMSAARRALLVRPALDPQVVLQDQQEALLDAMPIPAGTAPMQAATETATRARFHSQPRLLAEQKSVSGRDLASPAAPELRTAAPPAVPENAAVWSLRVSEAERQMARAAESAAEPLASLMDGPAASGAPSLDGAGLSAGLSSGPLRSPRELAAPQTLWKAVGAARSHQRIAAGRDPFAFTQSFASQPPRTIQARPNSTSQSSQPDSFTPGSAPAGPSVMAGAEALTAAADGQTVGAPPAPPFSLKALGYAVSADGNAQAVLTDGNTLYVVNEGEEFAERFRVIAIRPESLEVEDELTNQTIRLPLGD
jgi:hypothetical protein